MAHLRSCFVAEVSFKQLFVSLTIFNVTEYWTRGLHIKKGEN